MPALAILAADHGSRSFGLVQLTGVVLGLLLIVAAIRAMFGGGKGKGRRKRK